MRIEVTAKHIKSGRNECWSCPAVLAIRDALGLRDKRRAGFIVDFPKCPFDIAVNFYVAISYRGTSKEKRWSVPELREFEKVFDNRETRKNAQPFSFDLDGLEEFIAECRRDAS